MRIIDADSLMKKFDPNDVKLLDTIAVRYRIATEETVQSQKVGKWIFDATRGHSWMKCSECLVSQNGQTLTFSYCPNCGTKMEEGE